jgi:hypothetical protein
MHQRTGLQDHKSKHPYQTSEFPQIRFKLAGKPNNGRVTIRQCLRIVCKQKEGLQVERMVHVVAERVVQLLKHSDLELLQSPSGK